MKLGILGSGMIVQDLLSFVQTIPLITVQGIYARSQDKVQTLQEAHNIPSCFSQYEDMLSSEDIDTIYIGLPNHLHYSYAKAALLKGKHVICEKPFTPSLEEFKDLVNIAKAQGVMLLEAISNQYQEVYLELKEQLSRLGEIKIVECNYSQFSSRYKDFKNGIIHPVFNPDMAGGALMDINIYNIHFVVGLFGRPLDVQYFPNIENGIDTSGVLILDYGTFKSVCIGSKDSHATSSIQIQGTSGNIHVPHTANHIQSFISENESLNKVMSMTKHRMYDEFVEFTRMIHTKNFEEAEKMLEHSEYVMEVVERANWK